MQIKEMLVDNLVADWNKNTSRFEKPNREHFVALSYSIEEEGQKHPIHVFKNDDKQFEVEIGYSRYEAVKELNRRERASGKEEEELTKIQYVLIPKPNEKQRFLAQLSENLFRTNWTPMDFACTCKIMTEKFQMTQAEVAEKLGFSSQGSVSGYLSLFKLNPSLQKDVHNGIIPYTKALEILKEPEHTRQALADDAKAKGGGKVTGKSLKAAKEGSGNPKELSVRNPQLPQGPPPKKDEVPHFTKGFTDLFNALMKWEKKVEKDPNYITSEASMVVSKILSWAKGKVLDEDLRMFLNRSIPEIEDDYDLEAAASETEEEKEEGKEEEENDSI